MVALTCVEGLAWRAVVNCNAYVEAGGPEVSVALLLREEADENDAHAAVEALRSAADSSGAFTRAAWPKPTPHGLARATCLSVGDTWLSWSGGALDGCSRVYCGACSPERRGCASRWCCACRAQRHHEAQGGRGGRRLDRQGWLLGTTGAAGQRPCVAPPRASHAHGCMNAAGTLTRHALHALSHHSRVTLRGGCLQRHWRHRARSQLRAAVGRRSGCHRRAASARAHDA